MQDLFFLAGWVEMGQFEYLMFSFLSPKKSINFKTGKYHRKKKKNYNLSEFIRILCGLLSLLSEYFLVKMKCIGATLTVVSLAAVVWSCHTTPSISFLRENALHDETK